MGGKVSRNRQENVYSQVFIVTELSWVSEYLFCFLCINLEISGTKQFLTVLLTLLARIYMRFTVQYLLSRLLKFFPWVSALFKSLSVPHTTSSHPFLVLNHYMFSDFLSALLASHRLSVSAAGTFSTWPLPNQAESCTCSIYPRSSHR